MNNATCIQVLLTDLSIGTGAQVANSNRNTYEKTEHNVVSKTYATWISMIGWHPVIISGMVVVCIHIFRIVPAVLCFGTRGTCMGHVHVHVHV